MSIRALRTFVTIVQNGSFAAAAEVMGLTQPAVSLQIKKLEDDLQVELFDRSAHRAVLNAQGAKLLPEAEAILRHFDSLPGLISHGDAYSGPIAIGAINAAQLGPLPKVLGEVRQRFPNLQISLRSGMSGDLAKDVEAGRLDFAMATEPQTTLSPDLVWQPCYHEEFCVVAPLSAVGNTPKELLENQPFIRFDRQLWAGRMVDRRLQEEGIAVENVMELDSLEASLRMVEEAVGVAIVSLSTLRRYELQHLKIVPFADPPFLRPMGLIYNRKTRWSGIVEVFAELLARFS